MATQRPAVRWWGTAIDRWGRDTPGRQAIPRGAGPRRRLPIGGLTGSALVLPLLACALLGPVLVPTAAERQDLVARLAPPLGLGGELAHPLGTDPLGRDILARLVAGARLSLTIGVVAMLVAGVVGVALGVVAGYAGGFIDRLIGWVVDVQLAVPFVIVAVAVTATLGHGLGNVVLTLTLTGWVGYARVVRLQTAALRRAPWVEAARALGAGRGRLVARHVLPSLAAPIVVLASQQVAAMILYEAALSYLGLGSGGDEITWGGMVAAGRDTLLNAWWVSTIPGVAIALTVLGLNLLGDWLVARGRGR